uniref:Major basic nuclear protein n=1 Tax=Mucochytrium quahogii TaxID=96639 RepID=A0A7S2R9J3_9STRA|mmetsp:Transcript_13364/g.47182  ORF Transcript_13364/g.47182 Transcript_13364/m.47182 type:complete len:106 (-) Transcript_13364:136-453(-)
MAPKMKAMKSAAMSKGAFADALATACEMKKKDATKAIASVVEIATAEVKKNGVFTLPGLCRIKTRKKPATKAGKREVFGKVVVVKAKPARTVVKAFPVAALKKEF